MKITDLKTYLVHCYRTNWVFVKIDTDEGISGVGEATLEMKEKAVEAAVLELKDYLLGKDPREIERHFHVMYRDSYWRTGPVLMSALSAVEMAMWDISAKELGVPVYRLLGGKCNDRVKAYANAWFAGAKTPEAFAEKAKEAVARGFLRAQVGPVRQGLHEHVAEGTRRRPGRGRRGPRRGGQRGRPADRRARPVQRADGLHHRP